VLTVSSVNVNGVRAAAAKGLTAWLAGTAADVVCLQEVRARAEELPADLCAELDRGGWHVALADCATARGRSGVAVLSRTTPQACGSGSGSPSSTPPAATSRSTCPA
jgi:exodeoxyribonuclease-3